MTLVDFRVFAAATEKCGKNGSGTFLGGSYHGKGLVEQDVHPPSYKQKKMAPKP